MESAKPVYLTPEGKKSLQRELRELEEVRRPALAARLHAAIKQGDLSENADYIAAKEEQGFLEGRILEVKAMLRNAVIIESSKKSDGRVTLGSTVVVTEEGYDEPETYHIVGATEADPTRGRISNESPLGRALLGHVKGDVVTVNAPRGRLEFRITEVK